GSDIRPLKEAAPLEMGLWVRDGATPWQTLVAATRHAAAVCGVGAEQGTVEVGKLADLIVVGANPLEDITNVRRLQLVLKEGRVVSDKRHVSGAVPSPEGGGFRPSCSPAGLVTLALPRRQRIRRRAGARRAPGNRGARRYPVAPAPAHLPLREPGGRKWPSPDTARREAPPASPR